MSVPQVPSTVALAQFPFVDKQGKLAWSSIQVLNVWQTQLSNGLTPNGGVKGDIEPTVQITGRGGNLGDILSGLDDNGVFIGTIGPDVVFAGHLAAGVIVDGHLGTLGDILQYLDENGIVLADGVDFARAYLNKDTDHIADGTGFPLAGGKEAYTVLLASAPTTGQVLTYNGTDWVPTTPAASTAYLKGSVTFNVTGTSGTYYATTTIAGVTAGMAAAIDIGLYMQNGIFGSAFQAQAFVSTSGTGFAGNVQAALTVSGLAGPTGSVTLPVVVFP